MPHESRPLAENVLFKGSLGLRNLSRRYDQDEEIFGEGSPAKYIYGIVRGSVRSLKLLADGRRQMVAFHLPGISSAWSLQDGR